MFGDTDLGEDSCPGRIRDRQEHVIDLVSSHGKQRPSISHTKHNPTCVHRMDQDYPLGHLFFSSHHQLFSVHFWYNVLFYNDVSHQTRTTLHSYNRPHNTVPFLYQSESVRKIQQTLFYCLGLHIMFSSSFLFQGLTSVCVMC